ncbi:hypothetical protein D0C36_13490 [Mucilaginibacter conchicola]|uniref:Uncharacterized protein n=1 Tax=Mucilaginibacter conchicola TaxID=2303333 RepID=A0A372NT54_9SPHI|nr:hypothetical protein D0C36_13490 [Mucilaginibacter conchicola]
MMKQIIVKFVIPLAVICFSVVTMRTTAFVDDIGSVGFTGFPFLYTCKGFHTSMSDQFFLIPLFIDFIVYLLFWLVIFLFLKKITDLNKAPMFLSGILIILATLVFTMNILLASSRDNMFMLKRDFEIKVTHRSLYIVPWF